MDERKILLVRMNARWESVTKLIGSVLVGQILDAAYSRADIPTLSRKHFSLYADEFQWFANSDFSTLFSEARKYGVAVTIAHQTLQQVDPNIVATCKQARNIIVYRVSGANAKEFASEFDCSPIPGLPQEKPLRTPVLQPINHMATKGVHVSEATRRFAERYAKILVDEAKLEEQIEGEARRENVQLVHSRWGGSSVTRVSYDKRERLKLLNELFYMAMIKGKQGINPDTIQIDDIVADTFLQRFAEGRAAKYFALRMQHQNETNIKIIEATTRIEEIADEFAHNRLAIEEKNASLRKEEAGIRQQMKKLYKKYMMNELVVLYDHVVIIEKPHTFREFFEVDKDTVFIIPVDVYRYEDAPHSRDDIKHYKEHFYVSEQWKSPQDFFSTWEDAVRRYLDEHKNSLLAICESILLNQNNWIRRKRKVAWKYKESIRMRRLYVWELTSGVVEIAPALLNEELDRHLDEFEKFCIGKYIDDNKVDHRVDGHLQISIDRLQKYEMSKYLNFFLKGSLDPSFHRHIENINPELYRMRHPLEYEWGKYIEKRASHIWKMDMDWLEKKEPLEKELSLLYAMQSYIIDYQNEMADCKDTLQQIMRELALEPIQADSGLRQPIPTEISSSEVESRIANDLTLLPRFTAKVRLASGEHIITTIDLKGKLSDAALQEQIKKIQENNLKQGYLRLRSEVEKEIQDRQQPPEPPTPQPQPAQPKPKTPPTSGGAAVQPPTVVPTPRTRIIGTPAMKQCSACETQNAVTAKFCNGCGAKLPEK